MFNFSKKTKKCPICQMAVDKNAITKYGEKFCSESCVKKYEEKNKIADKPMDKGCCC